MLSKKKKGCKNKTTEKLMQIDVISPLKGGGDLQLDI